MEANQLTGMRTDFFSLIVVALIVFYQKVISPIKGFSCAHSHQHGGLSCSEYVKQVVLHKGVVSGYSDIRLRFNACRSAALKFNRKYPHNEAGLLDFGLDGCGDIGSCFDGGGAEGGSNKPFIVIIVPGGLLILLLIFAGYNWSKDPHVSAIDIRLIGTQQEAQDRGIARLTGSEHPDYQVIFVVSGRKIISNTLNNSSAKNWLSLQPKSRFEIEDLQQIKIINKQVLKDEVLEIIDKPGRTGSGDHYEYRFSEDRTFF
ncbi:membrane protein insertion efficiency factor YidD [Gammaproteobacteria bacterium]|nr:membrane protein insertion efficiency factor YidD [Gammaproteobacteria bacterium]